MYLPKMTLTQILKVYEHALDQFNGTDNDKHKSSDDWATAMKNYARHTGRNKFMLNEVI